MIICLPLQVCVCVYACVRGSLLAADKQLLIKSKQPLFYKFGNNLKNHKNPPIRFNTLLSSLIHSNVLNCMRGSAPHIITNTNSTVLRRLGLDYTPNTQLPTNAHK